MKVIVLLCWIAGFAFTMWAYRQRSRIRRMEANNAPAALVRATSVRATVNFVIGALGYVAALLLATIFGK